MAPCTFGIFGCVECLKKSCLKTFSVIKIHKTEQTVPITLWLFMLQETCIMSISFQKKLHQFAHLEICALIRHRPTDYHSLGVQTFLSVCLSVWCPQLQTAVLTWPPHSGEKPGAWQVTAHQTQTLAHKRKEGIHCVCVCVRDQSSSSVCACLSPWAEGEGWEDRWRSGQRDLISSPLGGIQVFLQTQWRAEEIKTLLLLLWI